MYYVSRRYCIGILDCLFINYYLSGTGVGDLPTLCFISIMRRILWICNRERCEVCKEGCYYTTDKEYAKNPEFNRERFVEDFNGDLWEQEEHG